MRFPGHHQLFGPVSISHDYLSTSQNLMVQFLEENRTDKTLARQVSAKKPFHGKRRFCSRGISAGQSRSGDWKPGVERMWSMLDIQAA